MPQSGMRSLADVSSVLSISSEFASFFRNLFVADFILHSALAEMAISGVGGSARKSYASQALALNAFNAALTWGGVQVV